MKKKRKNITKLCTTANASVTTMGKEVAWYKTFVSTIEQIHGGNWDEIMPSRKGDSMQKFKYYHDKFCRILDADEKSIQDYQLALSLLHERLWRLATIIKDTD